MTKQEHDEVGSVRTSAYRCFEAAMVRILTMAARLRNHCRQWIGMRRLGCLAAPKLQLLVVFWKRAPDVLPLLKLQIAHVKVEVLSSVRFTFIPWGFSFKMVLSDRHKMACCSRVWPCVSSQSEQRDCISKLAVFAACLHTIVLCQVSAARSIVMRTYIDAWTSFPLQCAHEEFGLRLTRRLSIAREYTAAMPR